MTERWYSGPGDRIATRGVFRHGCRTVLVVVPFVGAGTRLMDVLPLLEADHRISTVFAVAPNSEGAACPSAEEFLRAHSCLVLPWQEALRYEFDLVLAVGPHGLAGLRGKSLLLDRESVPNGECVLPDVLALSHDSELDLLAESCQEALPAATVVGDISYDRLLASIPFRGRYRQALGLSRGQRLVVTSTRRPDLVGRMVDELSACRFTVAVTIHPEVWDAHGGWQVRAWLADGLDAGALLLPPGQGWQGALIAADLVIGDCDPVTRYGAAIGLPTMVVASPEEGCRDPLSDLVRRLAPPVRADHPLADEVRAGMAGDRSWQDLVAARITSRPGRAGELLRQLLYRTLDLREPARAAPCPPVPLPCPITGATWWWKKTVGE
ncbi:hypothetical protein [Actinophytocola glycyrrhizae]|uniref:CDP-glycerol:poly(Glycerophosphate) glycerophosphotransferase n=1 Tax=Actinophytocola glycyrrhizae TaxID=2044873 RepID=A0ABV9S401_9PSEU